MKWVARCKNLLEELLTPCWEGPQYSGHSEFQAPTTLRAGSGGGGGGSENEAQMAEF